MGKFMERAAGRDYTRSWAIPGTLPALCQQKKPPLTGMPVSPAENFRRCVRGKQPYWMPDFNYDVDIVWPDTVEEHPVPEAEGFDWWGTEWKDGGNAGGMSVRPGTRVLSDFCRWKEELEWPDLSLVDFKSDGEKLRKNLDPERAHLYECTEGLFERLHELIPFDESLVAFYDEPELLEEFFSRMTDYKIATIQKIFQYYGRVDGVFYHDDWGTQRSGFFSNEMFREQLLPQTKRLFDFIREQGRWVVLHSCGKNMQYVPFMIEMGVDMWAPQEGINDPDELYGRYNDRISFAFTVPADRDMTEAQLRACVRDFVDRYGARGRVMARFRRELDPAQTAAGRDELYRYSREYYKALYRRP